VAPPRSSYDPRLVGDMGRISRAIASQRDGEAYELLREHMDAPMADIALIALIRTEPAQTVRAFRRGNRPGRKSGWRRVAEAQSV
jgi:hypothetical protein